MATIQTGRYTITNVKQSNIVALADPNDGTPLSADTSSYLDTNKWNVTRLGNGKYVFQNVGSASYANSGHRAPSGSTVEGRYQQQQWLIQETRAKNQFTIASTDSRLFWGLVDGELQTSVELSDNPNDARNWWKFDPVI